MEKEISVLMSVYKNDKPLQIVEAVKSIINQTYKAKQIVIVVDGPVPDEINTTLNELKMRYNEIDLIPLNENVGLGEALKIGTQHCKHEYIARMDSDDISVPERFQKQIDCFNKDKDLSLVGSNGQEFFNVLKNKANIKAVPENHDEIIAFMKGRCPFCHMSVMMKKSALEKAGGYEHWYYAEDYYLWIRMYLSGAKFYNIQENLVYIRINYDTFERRSGLKYFKSIKGLLKFMRKNSVIGFLKYLKELFVRFVGHVLVPKKLKNKLYMKYMRKESEGK